MKIGAVLEDRISSGGGYNQALSALVQIDRLAREGDFELVVYSVFAQNLPYLERLGIAAESIKPGVSDRIVKASAGLPLLQRLLRRLRLSGELERRMIGDGCDLAYFTAPGSRSLSFMRLNYISTLWDLCHRDFPEFPEVREYGESSRRDQEIVASLPQSILVLVDSELSRTRLRDRFGIDAERILAMPFSPAPFSIDAEAARQEVSELGLTPGFLYYPAQLWPHKNHVRLVEALGLIKKQGQSFDLVLTGGDKGAGDHIRHVAATLDVADQVKMLGFVTPEQVQALYASCGAVAMPTYFGPTNLPPLEAWSHGKPLVYPAHLVDQVQSAAALFDVDDAVDLARAIQTALDPQTGSDLAEKGRQRLFEIAEDRKAAEKTLLSHLRRFERRRKCWR